MIKNLSKHALLLKMVLFVAAMAVCVGFLVAVVIAAYNGNHNREHDFLLCFALVFFVISVVYSQFNKRK